MEFGQARGLRMTCAGGSWRRHLAGRLLYDEVLERPRPHQLPLQPEAPQELQEFGHNSRGVLCCAWTMATGLGLGLSLACEDDACRADSRIFETRTHLPAFPRQISESEVGSCAVPARCSRLSGRPSGAYQTLSKLKPS